MNDRLEKWKAGLTRTRKSTFGRIATFLGASEINQDTWEELEVLLIQADLGINTTSQILTALKEQAQISGWLKSEELKGGLRESLKALLENPPSLHFQEQGPTIIVVVGVNGSGKTTTIAKLGQRYQQQGKKVLLVAADTFRAAAIEQLQSWGDRLNLRIISGQPESDPGAVTFDGINSAVSRRDEVVLIDTAGRLHTRYNLMEELKKICRVSTKALPGAPHEVWLIMDATTGQNAILQAKAFQNAVGVTGVILTKLDSSARGGMAFAIQNDLGLPILYAGLGEQPEDLQPFDPEAFLDGILSDFG